jgi:hypothetical protein
VIDELCQENSYGKCRFCMMSTESLILIVLHILLDVVQRANELKENSGVPPSIVLNIRINDNDKSIASVGKGIFMFFCTPYYFLKCIMTMIFFLFLFTDIYST